MLIYPRGFQSRTGFMVKHSGHPTIQFEIGRIMWERGEKEKAKEILDSVAKYYPDYTARVSNLLGESAAIPR